MVVVAFVGVEAVHVVGVFVVYEAVDDVGVVVVEALDVIVFQHSNFTRLGF